MVGIFQPFGTGMRSARRAMSRVVPTAKRDRWRRRLLPWSTATRVTGRPAVPRTADTRPPVAVEALADRPVTRAFSGTGWSSLGSRRDRCPAATEYRGGVAVLIACGLPAADADAFGTSANEAVTLVDDLAELRRPTADRPRGAPPGARPRPSGRSGAALHAPWRGRPVRTPWSSCSGRISTGSSGTLRLQTGVDAVLLSGDLAAAGRDCRDLLAARAECGRGQIVTVFAAKGGCGKTTIAINLRGRAGRGSGAPGGARGPGPPQRRRGRHARG